MKKKGTIVANSLDDVKRQISGLDASEKAEILRLLVADLDGEADESVEELWLREAQLRYAELQSETVNTIPATEVFDRARKKLRG